MKNICFVSQRKSNSNSCNKQLFSYFLVTNLPKTTIVGFYLIKFYAKTGNMLSISILICPSACPCTSQPLFSYFSLKIWEEEIVVTIEIVVSIVFLLTWNNSESLTGSQSNLLILRPSAEGCRETAVLILDKKLGSLGTVPPLHWGYLTSEEIIWFFFF